MSKLLVRLTVVSVAIYLLCCYVAVMVWGIDIWSQLYYILFELCLCACMTAQGKYHCKYLRWTMYCITLSDILVSVDGIFDLLPYNFIVFVPVGLFILGLLIPLTLALIHYIKVRKQKKIWQSRNY
ncbi:MAG: hypothetical protein AUK63_1357 [bacterium P3]|nr:MAG: hypothetical protein AUK63_1357 [bacterium P3]KWW40150.1 MAG: hypothetical protein F083_1872 [bacterium F083]